jgi:thiamine pyrophosphate-dependent acetolactate synthase large subunit-like protein
MKFFSTIGNARRIVIFAGFGNNGGDGVVMAGLLSKRVALPVVLALADRERFSGSGKFFFDQLPPEVAAWVRSGGIAGQCSGAAIRHGAGSVVAEGAE